MRLTQLFKRLIAEERGGELLEKILILGLIAVVCVLAAGAYGIKVFGWWDSTSEPM